MDTSSKVLLAWKFYLGKFRILSLWSPEARGQALISFKEFEANRAAIFSIGMKYETFLRRT